MSGAEKAGHVSFDNIDKLAGGYVERPASPTRAKEGYWKTAFGLQAVDGLAPSPYSASSTSTTSAST